VFSVLVYAHDLHDPNCQLGSGAVGSPVTQPIHELMLQPFAKEEVTS
jgi:hypothetical protein